MSKELPFEIDDEDLEDSFLEVAQDKLSKASVSADENEKNKNIFITYKILKKILVGRGVIDA